MWKTEEKNVYLYACETYSDEADLAHVNVTRPV